MREPCPDWSPLGVNFKILDEHPYLFYISSPPPGVFFGVSQLLYFTEHNFFKGIFSLSNLMARAWLVFLYLASREGSINFML